MPSLLATFGAQKRVVLPEEAVVALGAVPGDKLLVEIAGNRVTLILARIEATPTAPRKTSEETV